MFGFRLYTAQLWTRASAARAAGSFALQLTYDRSINRERLVETSLDEMKRIGSAGGTATRPATARTLAGAHGACLCRRAARRYAYRRCSCPAKACAARRRATDRGYR
ncbi:hypothetical protein ACU4GD_28415 [Cupriavidus basilensis]